MVILHHHIGVLAHDVYLLYSLSIKLVEHAIIVFTKSCSVVFHTLNMHGIVYHKKASIQLKRTYFGQIKQRLFHLFEL